MRKRIMLPIVSLVIIWLSVGAWQTYQIQKAEAAAAQKIYTVSDIFKDADIFKGADFDSEKAKISHLELLPTEIFTVIEDEERKKQIVKELNELKLRKSENFYPYREEGTRLVIELDGKEYLMFLFEEEKNIFFGAKYDFSFDVTNGEEFFNLLHEISTKKPTSNS